MQQFDLSLGTCVRVCVRVCVCVCVRVCVCEQQENKKRMTLLSPS